MFPHLPLVDGDAILLLVAVGFGALWVMQQRSGDAEISAETIGFACVVAGYAYAACSFILIPPVDPAAFYHQRYVLPAVPFLLIGIGLGVRFVVPRMPSHARSLSVCAIAGLVACIYVVDGAERFSELSNDAKNIDDVQVQVGFRLGEMPENSTAWVVDAGATRYFANGYVVDMIGLNTPQILTDGRAEYLASHPPNVIEVVPGFNAVPEEVLALMRLEEFEPTTRYTVTSYQPMKLHVLAHCRAGIVGSVLVGPRRADYDFACE